MDIEQKTLAVIVTVLITVPFIAILTYVIYHFGCFIYHWHKVVTNVTNKYAQFLGPLILLSNSNFNDIGHVSLTKAKYHFRRFLFSLLPIILFFAVGAYLKNGEN